MNHIDDVSPFTGVPVRPGTSTVSLIRRELSRPHASTLTLIEASLFPLNRAEDVPYLETDIAELEAFLATEGDRISPANRGSIGEFLATRKRNFEVAQRAAGDQTDQIRAVPHRSATVEKDPQPGNWLSRTLGDLFKK